MFVLGPRRKKTCFRDVPNQPAQVQRGQMLHGAILSTILSRQRIPKMMVRQGGCVGWSASLLKLFWRRGPVNPYAHTNKTAQKVLIKIGYLIESSLINVLIHWRCFKTWYEMSKFTTWKNWLNLISILYQSHVRIFRQWQKQSIYTLGNKLSITLAIVWENIKTKTSLHFKNVSSNFFK